MRPTAVVPHGIPSHPWGAALDAHLTPLSMRQAGSVPTARPARRSSMSALELLLYGGALQRLRPGAGSRRQGPRVPRPLALLGSRLARRRTQPFQLTDASRARTWANAGPGVRSGQAGIELHPVVGSRTRDDDGDLERTADAEARLTRIGRGEGPGPPTDHDRSADGRVEGPAGPAHRPPLQLEGARGQRCRRLSDAERIMLFLEMAA